MKVFIAGPRKVARLDKRIKERLNNIKRNNFTVLVGDANGVDKAVQSYFSSVFYNKVIVYAVNGSPRNNVGKWDIKNVILKQKKKDFSYFVAKDKEMVKDADYGFMIWNGKSKGTLNNIINLLSMDKKTLLYFLPEKSFINLNNLEDINKLICKCDLTTKQIFDELLENKRSSNEFEQQTLKI